MADQSASDGAAQFVAQTLETVLTRSRRGQKLWSFANHGSTVCIVVFSAAAAVLSQSSDTLLGYEPKTAATVLSLCVTIISTVQSKLGFERKWIANRMTQSALSRLLLDEKTGTSALDVKEALKAILEAHDKAIAGTGAG
jgi:hypothetical protein